MNRSRIRRIGILCAGVLVLAVLATMAGQATLGPPERALTQAQPRERGRVVGGLKTYRDPVTGERRSPPPGLPAPALSASERRALSRSHEGLVAVAGQTSAGGTRVDLQGRFLNHVVASVGVDGTVSMGCLDDPPDALRGK